MSLDPSIVAADPARSAWVAANAGAGKTYTLANRVTRLLLADAEPEQILCLTYTKAAAAEMQDRLFRQLGKWAMLSDCELTDKVGEIGANLGGPEDMKKARRLFAKALETPGGLKILTIHAFCQNLLARFPLEAGVPASFTVLDDQTARELTAEARERAFERATGSDVALSAALAFLVTQTSEATVNEIVAAALGPDRRKLDQFFGKTAGAHFEAIRQSHGAPDDRVVDGTIADLCTAFAGDPVMREICAWLHGGSPANARAGGALAATLEMAAGNQMFVALRAVLLTREGKPREKIAVQKLVQARPDLHAALGDFQQKIADAEDARRAAHAARLAEAAVTVADAVRREYAAAKTARGALDYDDLIAHAVRLLQHGDAAAWVLYKLDKGIDHILIDEAQDTSPEQWKIVKELAKEFFAGEGAERDGVRTIFAVGDEKQSIFSFQGADPTLFGRNRVDFQEAAKAAAHDFVDQPLVKSRRSVREVLEFVDAVFKPEAARAGLTFSGAEIRHETVREEHGRIELWPMVRPDETPDPDPYVLPPLDAPREDSPVAQLARKVATAIQGWVGKTTLPGRGRSVRAGDIMILLPRREPFGTAVIRELKQRGIAVAGADRIVLTEQIAIMDLIALGRFVLMPEDDSTLAALLRSPLGGIGEDELFALAHDRKGSLWAELQRRKDETPAFGAAHDFLAGMRARADFSPPYEFYAHALGPRGMRLSLLRRLGQEANDAIDEFMALTFAYEAANTPSLEGFLHWIERGGAEIKRDMERVRDEVRVMTVHGAKGLEADIVILPDTLRVPTLRSGHGSLLYSENGLLYPVSDIEAPRAVREAKQAAKTRLLEEYRRLLYVALTRARDRLIVCGFAGKNKPSEGSWYELAANAARSLGAEIVRDGEAIHVVGDATDIAVPAVKAEARPKAALPPWLAMPAPRDAPAPRLVRPFDAAGMDEPATLSPFADNRRFARGLLVHALLAHLPETAPAERAALALQFLRMRNVTSDEAEALVRETLAVLGDPVFAAAFGGDSRSEVAIVADLAELGAGARVNGRIDRLAVTDDRVLIVDFKTNRPPPTREEDVAPLYATQMALYRAAAAKVFPARRIVCGLLWTEGPTLMELSNGFLDAELGRIRARLDPSRSGS